MKKEYDDIDALLTEAVEQSDQKKKKKGKQATFSSSRHLGEDAIQDTRYYSMHYGSSMEGTTEEMGKEVVEARRQLESNTSCRFRGTVESNTSCRFLCQVTVEQNALSVILEPTLLCLCCNLKSKLQQYIVGTCF